MSERETNTELHRKFTALVREMAQAGCGLPADFELFHYVHNHPGKDDQKLTIQSFLTWREAEEALKWRTTRAELTGHYDTFCIARGSEKFCLDREYYRHFYVDK